MKSKYDYTGIELDTEKRWEDPECEHHPKSVELFEEIMDLDMTHNGDYFCWKCGGDGDNGEELMYLLDIIFERRDRDRKQNE